MGSFVDFEVEIPESAGDMNLIFLRFALLTHIVLLLCFPRHLEQLGLFGGCRTQCGPPIVLLPSPGANSIFSTLVLFLVANFLFLELHHTGPVSRFVEIRSHPIGVPVALVRSISF